MGRHGNMLLLVLLAASGLAGVANPIVQIRTPLVDLEMEVFEAEKPITARNFIRLIEAGAYEGSFFHRLDPGFVIQGGGYVMDAGVIAGVPHVGFITNEFASGPWLSNTYGTVAMAKNPGDPDSASSQFFINLGNNATNLDYQNGGFTVFGRILRDGGLLAFLNGRTYGDGIVDLTAFSTSAPSVFSKLPVPYPGWRAPAISEFFYTDITLMRVVVTNDGGTFRIAWNSATGLTNVVEYTDAFHPPEWKTLVATNGNGTRYAVADTNAQQGRFYRVRVR